MPVKIPAFGPDHADYLIVGEAPGQTEEFQGRPFVGYSGQELDRMLHEAGIMRSECRVTNVCQYRPPNNEIERWFGNAKTYKNPNEYIVEGLKELHDEIIRCNPKVIIALGNVPLWALTGNKGISKWRGSQLSIPWDAPVNTLGGFSPTQACKVLPTYHPAAVLRTWSHRWPAVHDLRRAVRWLKEEQEYPHYNFLTRPSFEAAIYALKGLTDVAKELAVDGEYVKLSVDIETRFGHIECIGFAKSQFDAICIPFLCNQGSYWSYEEEWLIIEAIRELLEQPNVHCVGQNFLYDMQYIIKWWQVWPYCSMDTMIAHATCFPGTEKGLAYLSSMYCYWHTYWKDEGKHLDYHIKDENVRWAYNCKDAVITYEAAEALEGVITKLGLREQYEFEMSMFNPILEMMVRGVNFDCEKQIALASDMAKLGRQYEDLFEEIIGYHVQVKSKTAKAWYRSPPQMKNLFYGEFKCRIIKDRKSKRPSTNETALDEFEKQQPILIPLTKALKEYRSVEVYKQTFLTAEFDVDRRMRCYYNIVGAETFRFSSSKNAFDSGMNLQNLPSEDEEAESEKREFDFPNVRELFLPDEGMTILEWDLKQADAQVVVWEADDSDLKAKFKDSKTDMHTENAKDIFGGCTGKGDHRRQKAKIGVHLTNYMGSAYVLAHELGITQREAEAFQERWFQAHPNIRLWHQRIEDTLQSTRAVRNKFGYRRFYFDRIQEVSKDAAAWIPQSTVAIVIDKGLMNVRQNLPEVELLMQVHDSIVMQVSTDKVQELVPKIQKQLLIPIPYFDELIIPVTCKASDKSWGACEELKI